MLTKSSLPVIAEFLPGIAHTIESSVSQNEFEKQAWSVALSYGRTRWLKRLRGAEKIFLQFLGLRISIGKIRGRGEIAVRFYVMGWHANVGMQAMWHSHIAGRGRLALRSILAAVTSPDDPISRWPDSPHTPAIAGGTDLLPVL